MLITHLIEPFLINKSYIKSYKTSSRRRTCAVARHCLTRVLRLLSALD